MSSLIRLLKVSILSVATLTGLAACHPTYVHESYRESYVPAYGATSIYSAAPAYQVQYYPSVPSYVERRTVVVPRVIEAPPRVIYFDSTRHHDWSGPRGNRDVTDRHDDGRYRHSQVEHPNPAVAIASQSQVVQRGRNDAPQPGFSRSVERVWVAQMMPASRGNSSPLCIQALRCNGVVVHHTGAHRCLRLDWISCGNRGQPPTSVSPACMGSRMVLSSPNMCCDGTLPRTTPSGSSAVANCCAP